VGHGITEQFANRLLRVGILPEGEFNDGLILADKVSVIGIDIFFELNFPT
jgi:hypothetical protein